MFKIKVNIKPLVKELGKMKKEINKIQAMANTQLARDAGSAVKKEVRRRYNIPAKELTAKTNGIVQLWIANARTIVAKLITKKGKGVPLVKFKGLPRTPQGHKVVSKRTPTRITVIKGRTKILKSAFIVAMKSGRRGIFERIRKQRMPIKELFGPSAYDLYRTSHIQKFIQQFVKKNYKRIFKSKYDYYNKRRK